MFGLILSLLLGLGLPVTLWLAFRLRKPVAVEGSGESFVDARNALDTLRMELLPAEFVAQIFDREDLDFVTSSAPKIIQKRFRTERKRISIAWIRRVRGEVQQLQRFHLEQSRFNAGLSIGSEVRLAVSFASLLWQCRILEWSLRMRGPYGLPGPVREIAQSVERLCGSSEKALAFLTPTGFDAARRGANRPEVLS